MKIRLVAFMALCASALSAQVPLGNSFKGIYLGSFSNGDQFALVVSKNSDASFYVLGRVSKSVAHFFNFAIGSDGGFAITQGGVSIVARISQGTVTGTVPQKNQTLSGSLANSGANQGSYLVGNARDPFGNQAFCAFVLTGDFRAVYYVATASGEDAAIGTVDAQGRMILSDVIFGGTGSAALGTPTELGGFSGTINIPPVGPLTFNVTLKDVGYKLANLSTRAFVGTGGNILIAGFVVSTGAKTVLIRAAGPALGALGVSGVIDDPQLAIFDANERLIASNDNWSAGSTPFTVIGSAASSVGAFPFPLLSKDSALLLNLEPGNYTAQVSGVGNTTGVALVEVYEVD